MEWHEVWVTTSQGRFRVDHATFTDPALVPFKPLSPTEFLIVEIQVFNNESFQIEWQAELTAIKDPDNFYTEFVPPTPAPLDGNTISSIYQSSVELYWVLQNLLPKYSEFPVLYIYPDGTTPALPHGIRVNFYPIKVETKKLSFMLKTEKPDYTLLWVLLGVFAISFPAILLIKRKRKKKP